MSTAARARSWLPYAPWLLVASVVAYLARPSCLAAVLAAAHALSWPLCAAWLLAACVAAYLARLNYMMKGTPEEMERLVGEPWTPRLLREKYDELQRRPIDYTSQLPPRLDRRYIVTGGSGLVGGFIVLQLLARGTPPASIRIVDIRRTERNDMAAGPAAAVDFAQTDITSEASVAAAFARPWPAAAAGRPLTVFHTAAVIIPSDRSRLVYGFPEAVNVTGTRHVLRAAEAAGADVFSATSSGSIAIRPVRPWVRPWARWPANFCQRLDARDFFAPLRAHDDFFANYPASKAAAERLVCAANRNGFRTGCIRPANGVYGNPTDNTVGDPLARRVLPTWAPHVIQPYAHGANVAVAHLQHEAALVRLPGGGPQAGRPFVVTDPNPPIRYSDLYAAISTLSVHPFRVLVLEPAAALLLAHAIEWYCLLPHRLPRLLGWLPRLRGDARHLKPGLFSICTHLAASNAEAARPVEEGGLGYRGVLTTLEGMTLEILEWNREHATAAAAADKGDDDDVVGVGVVAARKAYTTSVSLADQIQHLTTLDALRRAVQG